MKSLVLLPFLAFNLSVAQPTDTSTSEVPAEPEVVEPSGSQTEELPETEEGFIDQTKAFLSKYLDEQLVIAVINWAIDAGLLSALFGVYLKFRKYKSKSSTEIAEEVQNTIKNELGKEFNKLTVEEMNKVYKAIENIEIGLNTTNKALVLAQDKTAEGKIALLNLISQKSGDKEVQDTANEVKEKIQKEEETKEEVNKEVSGDYNSVF